MVHSNLGLYLCSPSPLLEESPNFPHKNKFKYLESNPFLSKASNVVQNAIFLYDVTGFTQIYQT